MSSFIFLSLCTLIKSRHLLTSPVVGLVPCPKNYHYRRRCLERRVNHGKILLYNEHSRPIRCDNRKGIMMTVNDECGIKFQPAGWHCHIFV
jgi:hypothetical protein